MAETNMGSPALVALSMATVAAREIRASAVKVRYQRIAWVSTAAIRCLPLGSSSTFRAGPHRCPQPKPKSLGQQGCPYASKRLFRSRLVPQTRGVAQDLLLLVEWERSYGVENGPFNRHVDLSPIITNPVGNFDGRWRSVVDVAKISLSSGRLERFLPAPERHILVPGHGCEEWGWQYRRLRLCLRQLAHCRAQSSAGRQQPHSPLHTDQSPWQTAAILRAVSSMDSVDSPVSFADSPRVRRSAVNRLNKFNSSRGSFFDRLA